MFARHRLDFALRSEKVCLQRGQYIGLAGADAKLTLIMIAPDYQHERFLLMTSYRYSGNMSTE